MRSPGRPPVGRREHRQRFWVAIARGGSSEEAAAAAGVSAAVGIRWFREGGGLLGHLTHQGNNCARIDSTAEKCTQRDVTHQVRPDGIAQQLAKLAAKALAIMNSVRASKRHVPIAFDGRHRRVASTEDT
jgi:hypothetical protein